jgi:hypothetical protein
MGLFVKVFLCVLLERPTPVKTGWIIGAFRHSTWIQIHAYHPAPVKTGWSVGFSNSRIN